MKKNKNIVEIIKNNWYFVFLVIPFVTFCIVNRTPDNDIWFLMANGRYVLGHGIPYVDTFTIHEGLNYVMQQWLSSVLFYGSFKLFGKFGLLGLMIIVYMLISIVYYNLSLTVSNDKKVALFVTVLIMELSNGYIVTRPQIFTYLVLLLELLCIEKYIKNKDYKKLIPLPFLSLLLINMHASMWLLQFVFILPVLVNCIKIKGITLDKISSKPLIIICILMFLAGFINPYGLKAITFVFYTYGIPEIDQLVTEMKAADLSMFHWKICILLLLSVIVLLAYNKKIKLDIRFVLLLCGSFLFASLHGKCIIYFILYFGYVFSRILIFYKDINIGKIIKGTFIKQVCKGLGVGLFFCLIVTFFFTLIELGKNYKMETNNIGEIVNYILDNYDKNDVKLYVDFDDGGFTEFYGLKSYIDPRAELFNSKLNKKEDILKEYLNMSKDSFDFNAFLKKYDFSHLIVRASKPLGKYLEVNDEYKIEKIVYNIYGKPYYKLYVKKEE